MLDTVVLDQQACLLKLHPANVHVCQQTYLPLRMFNNVAQDQHTCLIPSSFFLWQLNETSRPIAVPMFFKLSSQPEGMFVTVAIKLLQYACLLDLHLTSRYAWISCSCLASTSIVVGLKQQVYILRLPQIRSYACTQPIGAPGHQACMLQLYPTSSHVFLSWILSAYMSFTVSSSQHSCIWHLRPTHVCNNCIWSFVMSFTVASNQQPYLFNLGLQACMSDTFAHDQHSYLYSNIQPSVLSVALAPDQYSGNGCYNCIGSASLILQLHPTERMQHANNLLRCYFLLIHCNP